MVSVYISAHNDTDNADMSFDKCIDKLSISVDRLSLSAYMSVNKSKDNFSIYAILLDISPDKSVEMSEQIFVMNVVNSPDTFATN